TAAGAALVAVTAQRTFDVAAEVATVSVGALAVALGALRLAAVPALRSWPALGPGLLVLLVPTLVLGAGGDLWRILGLVVVAGAVVAVGAARRLQAPVVVGGLVLAAHAVVQLAPYVADLTTSQWRWVVFAVVGTGLLVLGATYERRLVQLRAARTRIAALR
ncbi:MAG: SCO7613 C-terminal domain-containing membrane protein, partial [Kineosporiaceae bacterium]